MTVPTARINIMQFLVKWRPPARYVFVFMGFLCFNMLYALRVNLSVAIVSMVKTTSQPVNGSLPSSQCFNRSSAYVS